MCGIEEYSIADFKANHEVNGSSPEFRRVLYWFWTAVSNFTGKSENMYEVLYHNQKESSTLTTLYLPEEQMTNKSLGYISVT